MKSIQTAAVLLVGLCFAPAVLALASPVVAQPHINVRLLSSVDAIAAGDDAYLALELIPDSEWHVYWRNPGDSDMPPALNWTLSAGVSVEPALWPAPHKIPYGPLVNYGYEKLLLPVKLVAAPVESSEVIDIDLKACWLVCKESCIPGNAILKLQLPRAVKTVEARENESIDAVLSKVPQKLELLGGELSESGDYLEYTLFSRAMIFSQAKEVEFFPVDEQLVMAADTPEIYWKNNHLKIRQKKAEDFFALPKVVRGVLVVDHKNAWEFSFSRQP